MENEIEFGVTWNFGVVNLKNRLTCGASEIRVENVPFLVHVREKLVGVRRTRETNPDRKGGGNDTCQWIPLDILLLFAVFHRYGKTII